MVAAHRDILPHVQHHDTLPHVQRPLHANHEDPAQTDWARGSLAAGHRHLASNGLAVYHTLRGDSDRADWAHMVVDSMRRRALEDRGSSRCHGAVVVDGHCSHPGNRSGRNECSLPNTTSLSAMPHFPSLEPLTLGCNGSLSPGVPGPGPGPIGISRGPGLEPYRSSSW